MQNPADPVKPVSQPSRWSAGATYSPWWASARGTMNPSSPARASSALSAASRGGPWSGQEGDAKRWNNPDLAFAGGRKLRRATGFDQQDQGGKRISGEGTPRRPDGGRGPAVSSRRGRHVPCDGRRWPSG